MSISSPLAAAIARRNVEPDGRIWHSGAVVAPTLEHVRAIRIETRAQMRERAAMLRALRALPAAAPVEDVRAVLPVDSSDCTRDGAIARYERIEDDARQYLADLELARRMWGK